MAWLNGWSKRVKLTIDNTDIGAALSDFPVLIYLSTSSGRDSEDISFIFDELTNDANRKKIAVTEDDGTSECYVEIEKWDDDNEHAWLWVKVPSISDSVDTDLYLYYDSSHADNDDYVGDPNSTPAETVWDDNYLFVSHMRDDPDTSNIRDSTSSSYDGAKLTAGEPAITTDGAIADAQVFDGSDDKIDVADSNGLQLASLTVEAWVKPSAAGTVFAKGDYEYGGYGLFQYTTVFRGQIQTALGTFKVQDTDAVDAGVWNYAAFSFSGTSKAIYAYRNATEYGPTDAGAAIYYTGTPFLAQIGIRQSVASPYPITGEIDEVRISDIVRTAPWLKASYESGIDDLLDWGAEEIEPVVLKAGGSIIPLLIGIGILK